jgi:DNA-binding MarR family transcriptional regulator
MSCNAFIRSCLKLCNLLKVRTLREELPVSEKILQTLHNLCATAPDLARRSEELAQVMQLDLTEVERILDNYGQEGHVKSFTDNEGKRRYYLTGRGIIKVCALFT